MADFSDVPALTKQPGPSVREILTTDTHNGLDVSSPEEVDAAYVLLHQVKDEYGIKKLQRPRRSHGDYAFYFCDVVTGGKSSLCVQAGTQLISRNRFLSAPSRVWPYRGRPPIIFAARSNSRLIRPNPSAG